ncbi:MAG: hypothetical protein ACXVGB_03525 [Mycobacteriaceae bacterium]
MRPGPCSLVPACTVESAVRDRRLQVALSAAGYGLTQTLAAAPQVVARWENARAAAPYAWAVLTAALDAALYRFRTRCSVSESSAEKLLKHGG